MIIKAISYKKVLQQAYVFQENKSMTQQANALPTTSTGWLSTPKELFYQFPSLNFSVFLT